MSILQPGATITAQVIEPSDLDRLEATLQDRDVTLFFSESPTNPYLRCVDVRRIARLCHAAGATVCIDSTFATPVNQASVLRSAAVTALRLLVNCFRHPL
jgi:cystathionine gamma-synthase